MQWLTTPIANYYDETEDSNNYADIKPNVAKMSSNSTGDIKPSTSGIPVGVKRPSSAVIIGSDEEDNMFSSSKMPKPENCLYD